MTVTSFLGKEDSKVGELDSLDSMDNKTLKLQVLLYYFDIKAAQLLNILIQIVFIIFMSARLIA